MLNLLQMIGKKIHVSHARYAEFGSLEHGASHCSPEESATYQAASQVAAALDGRDPFSRRQNEDKWQKQRDERVGIR